MATNSVEENSQVDGLEHEMDTNKNGNRDTPTLDIKKTLEFLEIVYNLKDLPRRGWELRNVENPERIAGHMYAMGLMTFLLGNNSTLDRLKCLQLAVIHDLPECIVGDITPFDGIPVVKKHQLEDEALEKLKQLLNSDTGKLIRNIYDEYRAQETAEARFVKDLDKFDLMFTAAVYEKKRNLRNLQEFFDGAEGKFEHTLVQDLAKGLTEYRVDQNTQ